MKKGNDAGYRRKQERLEREEPNAREQHPLHDEEQLQHQHQGRAEGDELSAEFHFMIYDL